MRSGVGPHGFLRWLGLDRSATSEPTARGAHPPGVARLWAAWRSQYVRSLADPDEGPPIAPPSGDGTLFENILAAGGYEAADRELGIVHRGRSASVILNAYPYGSGHLLVLPNRGVATLGELSAAEAAELWELIRKAVAAVEAEYQPGGVNVGLNQGQAAGAGVPDHLHFHVLPRWAGDTNFMTAVAETRVLPESLDATWSRLRTRWASLQ